MLKMTNKDIKHDIKVLLKSLDDVVKVNNKELKDNNITLDDYLDSLIDNAEFNVRQFKELRELVNK